jgi:2-polyprenyl-6-methoxyphenol hydroxylase-like FAD-dependent oxidoreductase
LIPKRRSPLAKNHAVVIGGSMAGLIAARVLSEHFTHVTIIERDPRSNGPEPRPGVPQGIHVHALLLCGQRILENLFPRIREDYLHHGADFLDTASDFAWLTPAGWAPRFHSGVPFLAASRPLTESIVRQHVARLSNLEFLENTVALGLHAAQNGPVTGISIEERGAPAPSRVVSADLIVDASGRGSRAPDWLVEAGYSRPRETVVDGHIGYATRIYRRKGSFSRDWRASYSQAAPPANCRTGLVIPIEGDRWLVSLAGGGRDYPPTDENGFAEFARSLPNPDIYQVAAASEPLSHVRSHRGTQNRLRHYEEIKMPPGFIVLGDAACAFNPVYGQGMSTGAMGAEILHECLSNGRLDTFQRLLTKRLQSAWMFATSEDVHYPGAEGATITFKTRCMHRYIHGVLRLSLRDKRVRTEFLRVLHMIKPPSILFQPDILLPAIREAISVEARLGVRRSSKSSTKLDSVEMEVLDGE